MTAKLVVLLAVVFAVVALAWMTLLPAVLTSQLRERTGFDATVQSLSVNPLTGTAHVRGLLVTNPPTFPIRDFVRLREFQADAEVFTLWSDRVVFKSMLIDVDNVTLVKREGGQSNADAFQQHLTQPSDGRPQPPPSRPGRRFLIHHLTVRIDRLVIADYSSRMPSSHEYRLGLNQSYTDVSDVKDLLAPAALQSLAPVGAALKGLVPGELGQAIGGAVKDATKTGEGLLKSMSRKAGEKAKGYFDALEESRKP